MSVSVNGIDVMTVAMFLQNRAIKYTNNQFDMNDNFTGIIPFNGFAPKNAPIGTSLWGIAASFPLSENQFENNVIQFIFDLNGKFLFRTKDGSSGRMVWNDWKQIGG